MDSCSTASSDFLAGQVGIALRRFRAERRLQQYMLADLAGISRPSLVHYERGDRCPPLLSLVNLLAALGISWQRFGQEIARSPEVSP